MQARGWSPTASEEALEGRAVVQVLAGVDLVADVHARLVEGVEDRAPAAAELVEGGLDQARRALRPRVEVRPGEGAGEGDVGIEAEPARGLRGEAHLGDGPLGPGLRVAANVGRGEAVEGFVEGRVDGHELALEMGRELGDGEAVPRQRAPHLVAVGVGCRGLLQIEQARVPGRDLDALVAEPRGPAADRVEGVERRLIPRELGEEDRRAL